jgi:thiosulfate reductase cytochrome b subunit
MATYSGSLRSGLPRVEGGDPWPPAGTIGEALEEGASPLAEELETGSSAEVVAEEPSEAVADAEASDLVEDSTDSAEFADEESDAEVGDAEADGAEISGAESIVAEVPLRRGLPRVVGGDPWPPEGFAPAGVKAAGGSAAPVADSVPEASATGAGASESVASEPGVEGESEAASEDSSSVAPVAAAATAGAGAAVGAAAANSDDDESAEPAAADDPAGTEPAAAEPAAASAAASEVPLRRGLPRVAGGDPWPPEGYAPAGVKAAGASAVPVAAAAPGGESSELSSADKTDTAAVPTDSSSEPADSSSEQTDTASDASAAPAVSAGAGAAGAAVAASGSGSGELSDVPLRRGLPRTAGGDPWPPEGFAPAGAAKPAAGTAEPAAGTAEPAADATATKEQAETTPSEAASTQAASAESDKPAGEAKPAGGDSGQKKPQRRRAGIGGVGAGAAAGAAAAGTGAAAAAGAEKKSDAAAKKPAQRKPMGKPAAKTADQPAQRKPMAKPAAKSADQPAQRKPMAKPAAKTADGPAAKTAPAAKSASSGSAGAASAKPAAKKEPVMIGSKSLGQWSKLVGLGLGGLIVAAGIIVLAARGVTTLPGVPEFLERYPGEYDIPEFVDPGFPGWVRWTHFLNIFFMVLIIRSGLQVRHQQKPPAFYTPKKGGKKVSINLWLHTSLDVLWLANGVIFVVLLFISGHWARIVPTSWEVFPNALSAMLQYMTLEWPMEDAWVNYNSLQQLMYFIIVFIAAPVAAITGVRMSEWWPKDAAKLNKIYPAPLARALHFPTMLFFVFFILVHVFLVFATGLRQNLGYMFAGTNMLGWAGLIWFIVAMVVVVAGWFAARPLLMAPIANLFGRVSSR